MKGLLLALGLGTVAGLASSAPDPRPPPEDRPVWSEVKWPFLLDQWGTGRAFHCPAAGCGVEISIYLRAKVGFCNCATGVADDDEIDRVGDMDLITGRSIAEGPGEEVAAGPLKGRARLFRVESAFEPRRSVLAVALSNKCDAVVATVVTHRILEPMHQRAALSFLAAEPVLRWVEANTGQATTGRSGSSIQ